MNFKRVELMGFKSFADKIEIKFEKGITCIVGPNGCGKSNVADAIRWVLGEQSAKTLRGGNMQDVIFSGTQLRKSMSFCEVSLVFDNTDKSFDLEYTEVVFTRKLYRSGESEYLINRQPCRLKDIVAHLHSVGIGKEGYSIIGQNKISEIMNSKPDERRSIFEEATGIAVFKSKKSEIERKLANSEENLTRYIDIMGEVERQIAPLSKQAEKARLYFKLAEELKVNEINAYLFKHDSAADVKSKINLKIAGITEEGEQVKKELANTQTEYDSSLVRQQTMDSELNELHEKLREREVEFERQQGKSNLYFERINSFKSDIERGKAERDKSTHRLDEIGIEISDKKRKIDDIDDKHKTINGELEISLKELDKVAESVAIHEKAQELSRGKVISSIENLAEVQRSAGSLSAQKQVISERQEEILNAASRLRERKVNLLLEREKTEIETQSNKDKIQEKKTAAAEINQKILEINGELSETDAKIYAENTRLATLDANKRMLIGLKESFDGYNYSVKRLMTAAKSDNQLGGKIKGVIADIIKTDQEYELAIETAIGGAMQNIVTATADDARFLIDYLKRTKGGTVTFLPVSSVKARYEQQAARSALSASGVLGLANELVKFSSYYENIVRFLLGNTIICDNIASAVAVSKQYPNAFKIVTLEGDIINPSGSMTGGYKKQEAASLLSSERKLEKVEQDLKKSTADLESLKSVKNNLSLRKDECVKNLESLTASVSELSQKAAALTTKLENLDSAAADLDREIAANEESMDSITKRLDSIMSEFNSTSEVTERAQQSKSAASSELLKSKSEYENLKARQNTLADRTQRNRMELSTLALTKENFKNDIERLELEVSQLQAKIKLIDEDNAAKKITIAELMKTAEQSALSDDELKSITTLRKKVKLLNKDKTLLSGKVSELDSKKTQLTELLSQLSEKKYSQDLALSKVDSELDGMRERIWEEYQATYEGSQELRLENYNFFESKNTIIRLKKDIISLGNINYNAIEDYRELSERYEDMELQKQDLEKAHADLTAVLTELKTQMQSQFDEGFKQINENFKTTFKKLFGGGRAELQMDYADTVDPLNAGVEIVAEPPGKKLQKLSLLSGGEQALTAIAILFAILKLRAMPFCVLDEIEAALDEANVDRFARYLKDFSQDTQFIVITHRKPTMELADSLYGVTMEEKGVSRMVSVKLSDIENQLNTA